MARKLIPLTSRNPSLKFPKRRNTLDSSPNRNPLVDKTNINPFKVSTKSPKHSIPKTQTGRVFRDFLNEKENIHQSFYDVIPTHFIETADYLYSLCNTTKFTKDSTPLYSEGRRALLLDWMVSVHRKFKLCQDTLFLTVDIIDRFLSVKVLETKQVGTY